MSKAGDALRTGDIDAAIAAATDDVRAAPTDPDARWVLAEILLIGNDLERADKMLDAAAIREPIPAILEFRRLLRAEMHRVQSIREGRPPRFQGDDATPAQKAALQARVMLRLGDRAGAAAAAEEAEALRPRISGTATLHNGQTVTFSDFRDADDRFSAEIEILTSAGDYMVVPLERVRSLAFEEAKRPRDLALRKCEIDLKDGTNGVVYAPALYAGLVPETEPNLRLGRATEWSEADGGPVCGRGQRLYLAGDEGIALADIAQLVFE